jgi:hypothetical protein
MCLSRAPGQAALRKTVKSDSCANHGLMAVP